MGRLPFCQLILSYGLDALVRVVRVEDSANENVWVDIKLIRTGSSRTSTLNVEGTSFVYCRELAASILFEIMLLVRMYSTVVIF